MKKTRFSVRRKIFEEKSTVVKRKIFELRKKNYSSVEVWEAAQPSPA